MQQGLQGSVRPVGIRQDADKVDKSLLGDFRAVDERDIGEIEMVSIVARQISGPFFGCGKDGRHIGQPERGSLLRPGLQTKKRLPDSIETPGKGYVTFS